MNPQVSTSHVASVMVVNPQVCNSGSVWNVLFNPATSPIDDAFSPQVVITAGKGIFIAVYNLGVGEEIYTNMVAITSGCIVSTPQCFTAAGVVQKRGLLIDKARVTLGDADLWTFRNDPASVDNPEGKGVKSQMMITVPGRYQFELKNAMMASTIYMEYMEFDISKVLPPWPYMGGIKQ